MGHKLLHHHHHRRRPHHRHFPKSKSTQSTDVPGSLCAHGPHPKQRQEQASLAALISSVWRQEKPWRQLEMAFCGRHYLGNIVCSIFMGDISSWLDISPWNIHTYSISKYNGAQTKIGTFKGV
jgi:hypothetical protein